MVAMTEARLRALYGEPGERAANKVIGVFDRHCRDFIAASPFLVLATTDGAHLDVSPKGDPAGFVTVEDDTHLLLPDRMGNNRLDGLVNLLRNPKVALIFLLPTVAETLRVNGTAEILDDGDVCGAFAVNGRVPKTVLRIAADEVFFHCGKAPLRGGLWKPESWPKERPVATLGAIIRDHAQMPIDDVSQGAVDASYKRSMY